jgi:hypothetical protein
MQSAKSLSMPGVNPAMLSAKVNARFLAGDFGDDALHLRDACQIGVMDCVCEATRSFVKPLESYSSTCFAPRNQNDPGAHLAQAAAWQSRQFLTCRR